MKLTKEQVQANSQKKVDEVTALITKLKLVATGEQVVTSQGFIKMIIYYTDTEKYDVVEKSITPQSNGVLQTKKA